MKKSLRGIALLSITLILIIAMVNTIVFAEDTNNYSISMSLSSASKLKEGDTVTVKVNLASVNAGEGIDTITAELNYDPNVFEEVTETSIKSENDWIPLYASTTKMLTIQKNSKVKSAEAILNISLKVKSVLNTESTTITLKNIVASGGRVIDNGTGDITVRDSSITLSKEKPAIEPVTTNNTVANNTVKNNTVIKDNTTTKTPTLPKTGIEQYSVIAIVVIAISAVFSYVAYKQILKDVK